MSRKSLHRIALAFAGIVAAAAWPMSSMADSQHKQGQQQSTTEEETGSYGGGQQDSGMSGKKEQGARKDAGTNEQERTGAYGVGTGAGMGTEQHALDSHGQDFLKSSAQDSMGVMRLSKLAQQKASTPAVKQFAQSIVSESQNMDRQLQHLATQNNVTLPKEMTNDLQDKQKSLQGMSGKDFDKEYLNTVINRRQDDIGKFVEIAEKQDAPTQVRTFAIQSLPTLRMQVMQGQNIQQQIDQQGGQGTQPQQQQQQPRGQQRGGQQGSGY